VKVLGFQSNPPSYSFWKRQATLTATRSHIPRFFRADLLREMQYLPHPCGDERPTAALLVQALVEAGQLPDATHRLVRLFGSPHLIPADVVVLLGAYECEVGFADRAAARAELVLITCPLHANKIPTSLRSALVRLMVVDAWTVACATPERALAWLEKHGASHLPASALVPIRQQVLDVSAAQRQPGPGPRASTSYSASRRRPTTADDPDTGRRSPKTAGLTDSEMGDAENWDGKLPTSKADLSTLFNDAIDEEATTTTTSSTTSTTRGVGVLATSTTAAAPTTAVPRRLWDAVCYVMRVIYRYASHVWERGVGAHIGMDATTGMWTVLSFVVALVLWRRMGAGRALALLATRVGEDVWSTATSLDTLFAIRPNPSVLVG
jgi:hypothetical protein